MQRQGRCTPATVTVNPRDHHSTKAELEKDLSIPDATTGKLVQAVIRHNRNRKVPK